MINGDAVVVGEEFALADQVRIAGLVGLVMSPWTQTSGLSRTRIGFGQEIVIIILVHGPGKAQLAQVGKTGGALGLDLGFAQNRKQEGRQNGNRSDDSQQLDEREALEAEMTAANSCSLVLRSLPFSACAI